MILRAGCFALASIAVLTAADYKDVNRTVSLTPSGSVTIETHKGSIRVTTWDRAEVEIKARIEAEPGTTMDQRRFEGTDVRIVCHRMRSTFGRSIRSSAGAAMTTRATIPKFAIRFRCHGPAS